MTQIVTHITIDRPVETVFDYVTNPAKWPEWHPSSVGVDVQVDKSLRVGERVREDIKVGWQRDQVVWTVKEYQRPRRWIVEGQGRRGGSAVLEYQLNANGASTSFTRILDYRMPIKVPAFIDTLLVKHLMKAASRKAVRGLKRVLESKK
jgi:uncharacterized protein YndB with AHSA1/START domain